MVERYDPFGFPTRGPVRDPGNLVDMLRLPVFDPTAGPLDGRAGPLDTPAGPPGTPAGPPGRRAAPQPVTPSPPGVGTKLGAAIADFGGLTSMPAQFLAGVGSYPDAISSTPAYDALVRRPAGETRPAVPGIVQRLGAAAADIGMTPVRALQTLGNFLDPVETPAVQSWSPAYDTVRRMPGYNRPAEATPANNTGFTAPDQIANLPTSNDLRALMIRPVGGEAQQRAQPTASIPFAPPVRVVRNYLSDREPTITKYINGVAQLTPAQQLAAIEAQAKINETMSKAGLNMSTALKNTRLPAVERGSNDLIDLINAKAAASMAAAKTPEQKAAVQKQRETDLLILISKQPFNAILGRDFGGG